MRLVPEDHIWEYSFLRQLNLSDQLQPVLQLYFQDTAQRGKTRDYAMVMRSSEQTTRENIFLRAKDNRRKQYPRCLEFGAKGREKTCWRSHSMDK